MCNALFIGHTIYQPYRRYLLTEDLLQTIYLNSNLFVNNLDKDSWKCVNSRIRKDAF